MAIAAFILPKPRGAKIQLIAPPIIPRTLFSSGISESNMNLPFDTPNTEPAQTIIEASKITVPAFLIKDQPRSHIERSKFLTVGI